MTEVNKIFNQALEKINGSQIIDLATLPLETPGFNDAIENTLFEFFQEHNCNSDLQLRIKNEFMSWGPIESLLKDESITEIMINNKDTIWYEKEGQKLFWNDSFLSSVSFNNFVHRLCQVSSIQVNHNQPCADGAWGKFRVHIIADPLSCDGPIISLRRHPKNPWTLNLLESQGWGTAESVTQLKQFSLSGQNILIVGPTGSGKTSVLNALLQELPKQERVITIEDASEIQLPNSISLKLLTRVDPLLQLKDYSALDLLKQSLRMRPDRIVMGEMRGSEAKDYLMALSTGHQGGLSTLHADSAQQALLRLEMLIQLGAPSWNIWAIRNLIRLSLHYVVVLKNENAKRSLQGIYRISSLEESGFLLEQINHSLNRH